MKCSKRIMRGLLSLFLIAALLLPMAPVSVLQVEAVTQADIDKLKKQSQDLTAQRKQVQQKLADARAQKSELTSQKALLEDDIDLIQQTINSIESRISAIQEQINSIQGQINSIQSHIDSLDSEIAQLDQQIQEHETQIEAKQQEIEQTEAEEGELYELFCQRVRAMEEDGEIDYWAILFSSDSFEDLLDNFMMIEEFISYDNEVMDTLLALQAKIEQEKADLEAMKAELEQTRAEVDAAKQEQETAKQEQEAAKQEQEAARREQEAAKQEQVSAQQALKSQEAEMDTLISQISATEQDLAAQEAELKQAANAVDAQIKKLEQQMAPAISNVVSEGSFAWPLPGHTTLTSLYGGRIDPFTGRPGNHTGIDIPAAGGTPIHAAKSGVVTVSTKNGSYGNYVVVSHSDGTSTYAHMSSRAATVGQTVSQGAVVGYVGTTGRSTGNHLHFEVRINGARTDPARYFSGLTYRSGGRVTQLT